MRHLLIALLLACLTAPLAAQTESNAYLPVASWTTPYVEHLIRAGVLQGLDPLTRPLRRADVARAVAAADTAGMSASVRGTLRRLAGEFAERPDSVRWKIEANVAALGASDASRWAVRPAGQAPRLFVEGGLEASLEFPHVAMVTHPYFDTRLRRDPAYAGKKDRFIAGDNAGAYVIGSWKYLDVFFGSEPRNWGPPEVEGLTLSTNPYQYDHLFLRLGPRRLRLELLATQLDNLPTWDTGELRPRFLSAHRLVVQPSDRLAFSLTESVVYASTLGPNRSFEPWFLNAANSWLLENTNYEQGSNALLAADISYRLGTSLRLAGQFYADDIQVDSRTQGDKEPRQIGFTLSATGGARHGAVSWAAFYTHVDALNYRTPMNEEQYTFRGLGLARDRSDYDQFTARATLAPAPRALVTGELTVLRQGAADFRQRFPAVASFADSLVFLTGTVERTVRLATQATWTPLEGLNLSADVGRHFVRNVGHVAGARGDRWVWRVRAEVRRRLTGALGW